MNRNSESHFSNNPTVDISRSKFDRSFTHKTTFNAADLIPIYCDCTIMPGDTVAMKMSEVVRMTTPITPVMDNCNLDLYFFFVPYRLIWDHFKRFMGENDTAPWAQTIEYEIPQVAFPVQTSSGTSGSGAKGWHKGDLADYFGYPTEVGGTSEDNANKFTASILPFRAYCLVWNEFFRDENLQNPVNVDNSNDSLRNGISKNETFATYDPVTMTVRGAKPLKVCKYHDYFTSCLPQAQKGTAVQVPLGALAPVRFGESPIEITGATQDTAMIGKHVNITRFNNINIGESDSVESYKFYGDDNTSLGQNKYVGLYTDLSNAIGATVNQLRQAFAIQKFYEKQALGGTRYIEFVKTHFDVTNPDFRVQRPEYLGGKRIPISMNQVIQSTPTISDSTPLGTTGAFSVTSDVDDMFTHSFTEHGILLGLACVRNVNTYQQGLNRQYSKKKFTDFYMPVFANLGNMAVLNKEIYYDDALSDNKNDEAFGYQEAWASERYFPDIVTGELRSNYSLSLDIWHYADEYNALPKLGDKWIQADPSNIQRTLAVEGQDQFIADFYFGATYTRPMPLYSIPGLIDHH